MFLDALLGKPCFFLRGILGNKGEMQGRHDGGCRETIRDERTGHNCNDMRGTASRNERKSRDMRWKRRGAQSNTFFGTNPRLMLTLPRWGKTMSLLQKLLPVLASTLLPIKSLKKSRARNVNLYICIFVYIYPMLLTRIALNGPPLGQSCPTLRPPILAAPKSRPSRGGRGFCTSGIVCSESGARGPTKNSYAS